ncbi:uncharacterized protein LOC132307753 [Cornus florida]|uniref:uncharacterized protein LOC132307753 n=1 Tax=Cornus florida TaxID=4283 RepID=UPI0028964350|nr:uncharacterized protein LOC132307753 [Cornus florida]
MLQRLLQSNWGQRKSSHCNILLLLRRLSSTPEAISVKETLKSGEDECLTRALIVTFSCFKMVLLDRFHRLSRMQLFRGGVEGHGSKLWAVAPVGFIGSILQLLQLQEAGDL